MLPETQAIWYSAIRLSVYVSRLRFYGCVGRSSRMFSIFGDDAVLVDFNHFLTIIPYLDRTASEQVTFAGCWD